MNTYKNRKAQARNAGTGEQKESAQERALNLFASLMIEKIESVRLAKALVHGRSLLMAEESLRQTLQWHEQHYAADALREGRI